MSVWMRRGSSVPLETPSYQLHLTALLYILRSHGTRIFLKASKRNADLRSLRIASRPDKIPDKSGLRQAESRQAGFKATGAWEVGQDVCPTGVCRLRHTEYAYYY